MRKIKIAIIVGIGLIIILSAIIFILYNNNKTEQEEINNNTTIDNTNSITNDTIVSNNTPLNFLIPDEIEEDNEYNTNINLNLRVNKVNDANWYYTIKEEIIDSYYEALCGLNTTSDDIIEEFMTSSSDLTDEFINTNIEDKIESSQKKLIASLNSEYIKKYNINNENLKFQLGNIKDVYVYIGQMKSIDINAYISLYWADVIIIDKETYAQMSDNLMIAIDKTTNTYEIYPSVYVKELGLDNVQINSYIERDFDNIDYKNYNTYEYEEITEEQLVTKYFELYRDIIRYNSNLAYNLIKQEYKDIVYPTEDTFKQFVQDNYTDLINAKLVTYTIDDEGTDKRYTFVDNNGKYYVFQETEFMDFKVMLDNYTIMSQDQIQIYTQSTDQAKARYCIQRFMHAVNAKNYNFLYSVLEENYKNQVSIDDYKNEIQNIFNGQKKYELLEYEQSNDGINEYLTELTSTQNTTKKIKFFVKLKDETSFEIYIDDEI